MGKKLVLVGPAHPYRGGIAQFTNAMAEGLRNRGHEVQIVTFSRMYPELLFPGTSQLEPGATLIPSDFADLIDSLNPFTWLRVARRLSALKPDAVVFQYWLPFFAPAYATIVGRLGATPGLAVLHNVLPHERRPGDAVLGKYFLKRCDGFIALSESVARDLQSLGVKGTLRTTSHPVYQHFGGPIPRSEARVRLGIDEEAEVLLFFGFVRPYKGLHVLLEALSEIIRRRPDARLLIAGEFYEGEEAYKETIRSRNLEHYVHLHAEYIEAERVADFFSAADVVVQPYESTTQSGVVQTAFQFERPVIVTDVGGLAEVVRNGTGLVVPPRDSAALAEAVVRFFEDEMAERLVEGVHREKERHSWSHFVDVVESFLS